MANNGSEEVFACGSREDDQKETRDIHVLPVGIEPIVITISCRCSIVIGGRKGREKKEENRVENGSQTGKRPSTLFVRLNPCDAWDNSHRVIIVVYTHAFLAQGPSIRACASVHIG